MASFVIEAAAHKADKPDKGYGPMQVIALTLKGDDPTPVLAEWYTKKATAVPQAGSTIEGDLSQGQYGWSFKKASSFQGGGGSKDFKADPVKQAAIAMESAQKSAVEIMRLAMECKAWTPSQDARPVNEMTGMVKTVAAALYAQIHEVSEAAK